MTYNEMWRQLAQVYGDGEAKAIARMVYEIRYGLSLSDILLGKDTQLTADHQAELKEITERLLQQEPVQYILGQTDFCGQAFLVNHHVLIPRPETAKLCQWIIDDSTGGQSPCVLDIGTGSGCIAITLAAALPDAQVTAWDISDEALRVAAENAKRTDVNVSFKQVDVLNIPHSSFLTPHFSLIVSNPPYICNKERAYMESNVLEYEPHTALFVPDNDPLLFYRSIARYALTALKPGGWLYFEINPLYADSLREMLSVMSYSDIETKEDQFGKRRMMRAHKR